jgi:malonyl-CoA O-methyltransferase
MTRFTQLNEQDRHRLDKNLLRRSFERAAHGYDEAAFLQQEVGRRMLERLDFIRLPPKIILDIGAGTGACSSALSKRYKGARVIALDFAVNMLRQARKRVSFLERYLRGRQAFICGDAQLLPIATASVDMIFSCLTLQWCDDLDHTFKELHRVLKPGGLLMFSTFGPDTLKELRASWAHVDDFSHVNAFMDMHDIGDALIRARMSAPVMDVEYFTLTYPDVMKLMHDLKTLGAHNVTVGRADSLTGKNRLKALIATYERYRSDDQLPATYEVVYGHAWAPENNTTSTGPTVTKVPVSQISRSTGK